MSTINDYSTANSIDAAADYFLLEQGGAYLRINRNTITGLTGTPADISSVQTLSNKVLDNTNTLTIKDSNLTIQNASSTTKQAVFSAASITAGQTRTYTLPDVTDTIVTNTSTSTLTNKTLTSPTINGGTLSNVTIAANVYGGYTNALTGNIFGIAITSSKIPSGSFADGAITPQTLVAGTGSSWAWQAYTPNYTNLTVGNGTHATYYIQNGKEVKMLVQFTFGNTSSMGSTPIFSLPVTASSSILAGAYLGMVRLVVNGAAYQGFVYFNNTTTALIVCVGTAGTYSSEAGISASVPNTWGTSSIITGIITYWAA